MLSGLLVTTAWRVLRLRKMGWSGHVARMGDTRNAYKILVEKFEGKSTYLKDHDRREDDIKVHFEVLTFRVWS
jgi:hypothetical protein